MADHSLTDGKLPPPPPELFENHSHTAPNFDIAEHRYFDSFTRNLDLEGPLAKSSIPLVTLFDSSKPHQPNQTVVHDKFALPGADARGRLELHYGPNGQPESARFVDQDGNVEVLNVNQKDPSKIAEDHYDYKKIGVTADFKFEDGHVRQESIVNADLSTVSSDYNSGFHYKFQTTEGSLNFSEDASGRSMSYSATQATRDQHKDDPSFIVGERFEYNDPRYDNGQATAIVLTRLNGDQFRAERGPDGGWQVTKLEPK
jgi:hypothetical protein